MRAGNLQPEGEPGKRWLCLAASLPLATRKGRDQVLFSSIAGPVPGAGRWRGRASPSSGHGSRSWARRNAPPGGSEFPFRWGWGVGGSVQSLRCKAGGGWEGVSLLPQCLPPEALVSSLSPPSTVIRPGRAGRSRSRQLARIGYIDPSPLPARRFEDPE